MRYMGLPKPAIHIALPLLDAKLPPADHAKAMAILKEYAHLFSVGPSNYGFSKKYLIILYWKTIALYALKSIKNPRSKRPRY